MLQAALRGKHLQRMMLVAGVMLFILYLAMVVIPTFNFARGDQTLIAQRQSAASPPAASAPAASPPATSPTTASPTAVAVSKPGPGGSISSLGASTTQTVVVVVYAFLAPITRTSAPALYYAIISLSSIRTWTWSWPDIVCSRKIGCHGLRMPDDNIVVWVYMNPTVHGGTVAVPFQFVLYWCRWRCHRLTGSRCVARGRMAMGPAPSWRRRIKPTLGDPCRRARNLSGDRLYPQQHISEQRIGMAGFTRSHHHPVTPQKRIRYEAEDRLSAPSTCARCAVVNCGPSLSAGSRFWQVPKSVCLASEPIQ